MRGRIRVLSGHSLEGAKVGVECEFFTLNLKLMTGVFHSRKNNI